MAQRYEITESVSAVALVATPGGVLVPGASATATIKDLLGNNLTVYAAETGATTATNPITTDAFGRIEGWVEAPDYDIVVTGVTSYTQKVRMSPPGTFNAKSYGARFDGSTNDTAAMQAASDAANTAGGGTVVWGAGTAMCTTLTYYGFVKYVGAGARATTLTQISGTASPMMQPNATTGVKYVTMEDFALTATGNASNTGGLLIRGVTQSNFNRIQVNGTLVYSFQVLGGSGGATSGDAMYNNLTNCTSQNLQGGYGFQLSPASGGGSHPDGTVLSNCFVNSAIGTAYRIDAATVDASGALGPDACMLTNCRSQQVPVALDIQGGQGHQIEGGRFERTGSAGATMSVIFGAGTTNNPTKGIKVKDGFFATHATTADLVWTDGTTNGVTRTNIHTTGAIDITDLPPAPATTQPNGGIFIDSTDKRLRIKDSAGVVRGYAESEDALSGIVCMPRVPVSQGTRTLSAASGTGYATRFVPSRDLTITLAALHVTVLDAANVAVDVGIYSSGLGSSSRIASSGATTGILNATGVKTVSLSASLKAGIVYYAVVSFAANTTATLGAYVYPDSSGPLLFGSAAGTWLSGTGASMHPLPSTPTLAGGSTNTFPLIVLRES